MAQLRSRGRGWSWGWVGRVDCEEGGGGGDVARGGVVVVGSVGEAGVLDAPDGCGRGGLHGCHHDPQDDEEDQEEEEDQVYHDGGLEVLPAGVHEEDWGRLTEGAERLELLCCGGWNWRGWTCSVVGLAPSDRSVCRAWGWRGLFGRLDKISEID